jgi:hypothetical protein
MVVSQQLTDTYRALQREAEGYVLLMQVGAFMQVMDEDARRVSAITGLKLQMGGAVDDPVVLGGFPKSGLDQYVGKLVRANNADAERKALLAELRVELEQLQVLIRLCHESGGFASTRAYLYVSEQVVGIAKQNEGWLRSGDKRPRRGPPKQSGEAAHGQNSLF